MASAILPKAASVSSKLPLPKARSNRLAYAAAFTVATTDALSGSLGRRSLTARGTRSTARALLHGHEDRVRRGDVPGTDLVPKASHASPRLLVRSGFDARRRATSTTSPRPVLDKNHPHIAVARGPGSTRGEAHPRWLPRTGACQTPLL